MCLFTLPNGSAFCVAHSISVVLLSPFSLPPSLSLLNCFILSEKEQFVRAAKPYVTWTVCSVTGHGICKRKAMASNEQCSKDNWGSALFGFAGARCCERQDGPSTTKCSHSFIRTNVKWSFVCTGWWLLLPLLMLMNLASLPHTRNRIAIFQIGYNASGKNACKHEWRGTSLAVTCFVSNHCCTYSKAF